MSPHSKGKRFKSLLFKGLKIRLCLTKQLAFGIRGGLNPCHQKPDPALNRIWCFSIFAILLYSHPLNLCIFISFTSRPPRPWVPGSTKLTSSIFINQDCKDVTNRWQWWQKISKKICTFILWMLVFSLQLFTTPNSPLSGSKMTNSGLILLVFRPLRIGRKPPRCWKWGNLDFLFFSFLKWGWLGGIYMRVINSLTSHPFKFFRVFTLR